MANRKARRQQGSGVTAVLIPSVICKPAEEIEKATGKEEQFRVVKGRVIEKNLPCISPFEFTAAIKGNFFAGVPDEVETHRSAVCFPTAEVLMVESELVCTGWVSQSLRGGGWKQQPEIRVQFTAISKQEGQVIKSQFIFSVPKMIPRDHVVISNPLKTQGLF